MKTIFAVDDSITSRTTIEYALTKEGFKVILSEDGDIALKKLKETNEKIDVCIFDINMPNMDGITLIKEVRKLPKYKFTPILFLTTESEMSKKMEGKNAGASGWIVKPFNPDTLIKTINKF